MCIGNMYYIMCVSLYNVADHIVKCMKWAHIYCQSALQGEGCINDLGGLVVV